MCRECRQIPCDSRCPNAETKVIAVCNLCREEVEEGYDVWTDEDNNDFCSKDCACDFRQIRIKED